MLNTQPNVKRNDGRLIKAVKLGDIATVRNELSQGDIDLGLTFDAGKSFLRHAGERGFKQIACLLIEHGANPNEVFGKRQYSLLHSAVASHNFGFASLLLQHHADSSPRNSNNATPLHFAARTGQSYMTSMLIEHGADLDAIDTGGRTPLFVALSKGQTDIAKLLFKANCNPEIPSKRGVTPRLVAEAMEIRFEDIRFGGR